MHDENKTNNCDWDGFQTTNELKNLKQRIIQFHKHKSNFSYVHCHLFQSNGIFFSLRVYHFSVL